MCLIYRRPTLAVNEEILIPSWPEGPLKTDRVRFCPRHGFVFKGGISMWVRFGGVGPFSKATWVPRNPTVGTKGGDAMNPGIMLVLLLALDMSSGICSLPRMVLLSFPGSWGCPMPHLPLGRSP